MDPYAFFLSSLWEPLKIPWTNKSPCDSTQMSHHHQPLFMFHCFKKVQLADMFWKLSWQIHMLREFLTLFICLPRVHSFQQLAGLPSLYKLK